MIFNKVEEHMKYYWRGWDDFNSLEQPVCPYETEEQVNRYWWLLGYTDAERKEKSTQK